ncbi:class I SAM-dependent methyltransferase [Modestobacter altitudinis]|uniref:class I SAM-dependent methyltransferase n=1 Tax=Modestobacter altitudinis TaxID=2213158 RepID=UPI00110CE9B0|nr:class I SAM-dependent methyltransferase [Modestobacter altitudinis]
MHEHQHEHEPASTGHDHASWEDRYRDAPALWSGRVNPPLAAEATGLAPGRALDVGCGEGGDALWLAGQGWQVTGLDWSEVALTRAAEHAAAAGVTDRVTWVRGDIHSWQPPVAAYDLVTAHFLHPTADQRHALVPRLAAAVAPGGTLLWVGHPYDEERAALWGAERFATAAEVAADLDPGEWEVLVAAQRPRPGEDAGHHHADEIVRARRRG